MADQQREFKGIWIPREVWLDDRLNALDKVIFAEIDSFSSSGRVCFKSNAVLAEFCQCSESKVSKTVSKLIDLGYIRCVSFDGRKRFLQSCLVNFTRQNSTIYESAEQILQDSNTVNNSLNNIFNITPSNPPMGEDGQPQAAANTKPPKRKKATAKEDYDLEGFNAFYAAYPRHEGKADALRAWNKLKPDIVLQTKMGEALTAQKKSPQWLKNNGQYIPMPSTWLNGKRWEDEAPQSQSSSIWDNARAWAREQDQKNGDF